MISVFQDRPQLCSEKTVGTEYSCSGQKWSSNRSLVSNITCISGEEDSDSDSDEDLEELLCAAAASALEDSTKHADCKPFIPTRQKSDANLNCKDEDVSQDGDSPPTKPRRSFSFASDSDSDDEHAEAEKWKSSQKEECAIARLSHVKLPFLAYKDSRIDNEH
jgi:hypothetical protein